MTLSYEAPGDSMPGTRPKALHSLAAHAKVKWIPNESTGSYITGLMTSEQTLIMRWSCAIDPSYTLASGPIAATAFKFLIDGKDSVNFFANFYNPPLANWNYLATDYTSHLAWGP